MLSDVFIVALDVVFELRAVLGEVVSCRGHRHHGDVHKIRRTAHHAAADPGPVGHHGAPPLQILNGPGGDE
jgi:hypothetical protein